VFHYGHARLAVISLKGGQIEDRAMARSAATLNNLSQPPESKSHPGITILPSPLQAALGHERLGIKHAIAHHWLPQISWAALNARLPPWLRFLASGILLWLVSVGVLATTQNYILVPTVIVLGTFLVPMTIMLWAFARTRPTALTGQLLVSAFVPGGALGIMAAALIEYRFLSSTSNYIEVGLFEEAAKLAVLVGFACRLQRYAVRDGILLGGAVGLGYAALESSGYALDAFTSGWSLTNLLGNELLRAATVPLGHGLWTGILGGVLFAGLGSRRRLRAALLLGCTYAFVVALHATWDSLQEIAMATAQWLLHSDGTELGSWVLDVGGSTVISAIGLATVGHLWRIGATTPRPSSTRLERGLRWRRCSRDRVPSVRRSSFRSRTSTQASPAELGGHNRRRRGLRSIPTVD
jgi:protease PrsW